MIDLIRWALGVLILWMVVGSAVTELTIAKCPPPNNDPGPLASVKDYLFFSFVWPGVLLALVLLMLGVIKR